MSGHLRLSNLTASNIAVDFISSDLIPAHANVSLGSATKPFKDLFVSSSTIHLGTVSLGESGGNLTSSAPMEIGTDTETTSKVTIGGTNNGITIGSTQIDSTGLKINDGSGGQTSIGADLFTRVETIAKEQASTQLTRNVDDFGYLVDYTVNVLDDSTSSNNVVKINNGNFELGKLFNSESTLGLNTFVTKTVTNNLYTFNADGTVELFTVTEQVNRLNKKLDDNAINITLNAADEKVLIPIETNTTIRDVFPLNILDVNKKAGRMKFKSDFDTIGSLYFTTAATKLSGICNLKNYVQVSDPQFISSFAGNDRSISLSKYEYIVDFISYYSLPILFEAQKEGDDLTTYEYYLSSLPLNRKDNTLYKTGFSGPEEEVFGQNISVGNTVSTSPFSSHSKTFYPAIRAMRWKNTYASTFTTLEATDYAGLKEKLNWESVDDIYTTYTTGTNTGENWILKLVELTYAYIKYGRPLKPLNAADTTSVQSIMTSITNDKTLINLNTTNMEITIKATAF